MVNVTATDAYNNRWTTGVPNLNYTCAACSGLAVYQAGNGRTDFAFTFTAAGSQAFDVAVSGPPPPGVPIDTVTFNVLNAGVDASVSRLTGPAAFTAGDSVQYTFTPRDAFGNVAMYNYVADQNGGVMSEFDAEVLPFAFSKNVSWPVNASAEATGGGAYTLTVQSDRAGVYALRVEAGELSGKNQILLRPEVTLAPITIAAGALSAARAYLRVRRELAQCVA
jgi:hypothetical protein